MGLWRSAGGLMTLRLCSADAQAAVQTIVDAGVILFSVRQPDELTAEFVIRRRDFEKVRLLAQKRFEDVQIVSRAGLFWGMKALLRRKLLLAGMVFLLLLVMFLPTRVLFIRVEGNREIPANLILEKAAQCGISFGASRREVRSERVKNALIQSIPELQWVGVNTSGCTATISVRERTIQTQELTQTGVSRIVASRDGVITDLTCTQGNALCAPGQAVRQGQTLISGFTDCGLSIRAQRAQGEVFALTKHEMRAVLPAQYEFRGKNISTKKSYSLIVGKKRINLWKDSGISGTSCAKIYEEIYVTLPGGFQLPVKLVVETWTVSEMTLSVMDRLEAQQTLEDFARSFLTGQMISGTIQAKEEIITQEEAFYALQGSYDCLEMIGRERSEEIIHEKTD